MPTTICSCAAHAWQNLVNFGILPLEFSDSAGFDQVGQSDILVLHDLHAALRRNDVAVENRSRCRNFAVRHRLSERQIVCCSPAV